MYPNHGFFLVTDPRETRRIPDLLASKAQRRRRRERISAAGTHLLALQELAVVEEPSARRPLPQRNHLRPRGGMPLTTRARVRQKTTGRCSPWPPLMTSQHPGQTRPLRKSGRSRRGCTSRPANAAQWAPPATSQPSRTCSAPPSRAVGRPAGALHPCQRCRPPLLPQLPPGPSPPQVPCPSPHRRLTSGQNARKPGAPWGSSFRTRLLGPQKPVRT